MNIRNYQTLIYSQNPKRKSSESPDMTKTNCIKLYKSASGLHNVGYDPQWILSVYYYELTAYERSEITEHKSIYFFGKTGVQKFNGRFSSKKGIYRGLTGDHLKYRYEIIRELGRGSFGIVFECWDHKISDRVAIKIIKCKEKYRRAGDLESLLLEKIQEIDASDNSSFVHKYKTFEFRGHLCLVFELLYSTLYTFLQENSFSGIDITVVKRITVQLLQGLKQLHSLHYLHCDLKPDNIMLKYQNKSKIKIIDLGSAVYSFYKDVPRYVQTRYYRAPEIILGINYDCSIDFWSLGCVIVELLTGRTLFQANDEEELLYKIISLIGDPPDSVLKKSKKAHLYFNNNLLKFPEKIQPRYLGEILTNVNQQCVDFVRLCLEWDSRVRLNYESGLNHPWIRGRPLK